jgi:hypothetical protein
MVDAFGPESQREYAREQFVGNEASSDEYRETQPYKLLGYIGMVADILSNADDPRAETFQEQVKTWVAAFGSWYEGADEAGPLLETIFNVLWDEGRHPYYDYDRAEYVEFAADGTDTEEDGERMRAEFAPFIPLGEAMIRRQEDDILATAERIRTRRAAI